MKNRFWAFKPGAQAEAAELWLEGEIVGSRDWWYEGETVIVPDEFRAQLDALKGKDITVWINSPGGDAFAGMCIYTLLKEHKGKKTCKIAGIAASAATIPPMACDEIWLSPASIMMIHDASTVAFGREEDLEAAQNALRAVNETMADLYAARSGKPRDEILQLMHAETYMSPAKAIDLKFADGVMYEGEGGVGRPAALITLKDIKWPKSALDDHEAAERKHIAAEALAMKEAADKITWKPGT
jgi:ATP-dependent Clp protease protease subunit